MGESLGTHRPRNAASAGLQGENADRRATPKPPLPRATSMPATEQAIRRVARRQIHAVAAQSPHDRDHLSAARVKPIVNLALGPVLAGSMRLFRTAPESRGCRRPVRADAWPSYDAAYVATPAWRSRPRAPPAPPSGPMLRSKAAKNSDNVSRIVWLLKKQTPVGHIPFGDPWDCRSDDDMNWRPSVPDSVREL